MFQKDKYPYSNWGCDMCYYGYKRTRHPLRHKETRWTMKFDELGIETSAYVWTAKLPIKQLNLYYKTLSGKTYSSANLDFTTMSGYLAFYPEDEEDHYSEDPYDWAKAMPVYTEISKNEIDLIKFVMPKAGYVLDKLLKNNIKDNCEIYDALIVWQKHPEMEYLIANGFCEIGLDRRFWRLTESKMKSIIQYCKQHKGELHNPSYTDVRDAMNGVDIDLKHTSQYYKVPYGVTNEYINSLGYGQLGILKDYYQMVRELKKDLTDKYWLMPKDISAAHEKVKKELENTKRERNNAELEKVVKALIKYGFQKNGYTVFVPTDWLEIKKQADALDQCLITCEYDKKMMEGKCILVFIQKKGKPIATMEVVSTKKRGKREAHIGQFYMDERDRNNCLPTPEIRALGQKWLDNYLAA